MAGSTLRALSQPEPKAWRQRDLADHRYAYCCADGVYSKVRLDDRLCLLAITGGTEHGHKELVAVEDGHRESETNWTELLTDLRKRDLTNASRLGIGDGALGFWRALSKAYPATRHKRCWIHKNTNALNKLAETHGKVNKVFNRTLKRFEAKSMGCLAKDREELLAFYVPAEHLEHIRTINPIESTFATARLRTKRSRSCGSRDTTLAMIVKLLQTAQKPWRRTERSQKLELITNNDKFQDWKQVTY